MPIGYEDENIENTIKRGVISRSLVMMEAYYKLMSRLLSDISRAQRAILSRFTKK